VSPAPSAAPSPPPRESRKRDAEERDAARMPRVRAGRVADAARASTFEIFAARFASRTATRAFDVPGAVRVSAVPVV
jgi:hypothetical protein